MEKLNEYKSILGFGALIISGFLWLQANFVSASDLQAWQNQQVIEQINYLKDKRERLERENKQLSFEDKRQLERLEDKLKNLKK